MAIILDFMTLRNCMIYCLYVLTLTIIYFSSKSDSKQQFIFFKRMYEKNISIELEGSVLTQHFIQKIYS